MVLAIMTDSTQKLRVLVKIAMCVIYELLTQAELSAFRTDIGIFVCTGRYSLNVL